MKRTLAARLVAWTLSGINSLERNLDNISHVFEVESSILLAI